MVEIKFPGVYVEEVATGAHSIDGVATSTAAFVGAGPSSRNPVLITSFVEFEREIGVAIPGALPIAVRGFFENGGRRCHVALGTGSDPIGDALESLDRQKFSLLCCPDEHQFTGAAGKVRAYCERCRDLFGLVQPSPPLPDPPTPPAPPSSFVAAVYPWIVVRGLDGTTPVTVPPGGHIAGAIARTDIERGVHVTPENARLIGVLGVSDELDDAHVRALVAVGINVVRKTPDRGIVLWGARTTGDDAQVKYVHVRRLLIFLAQSIVRGLGWAVFEPNDPVLWGRVARAVGDFLLREWTRSALVGPTAEKAFFVQCDRTTMTQDDLDNGRFVAIVGVAPLHPAEFVILRFTGQTKRRPDDD